MATYTIISAATGGGDFTSLNAAMIAAGTVDNDVFNISGDWTTRDATETSITDDNLTIQVVAGDQARHDGFDNDGTNYALRMTTSPSNGMIDLGSGCDSLTMDGLILRLANTGTSDEGVRIETGAGAGPFVFQNCIFIAEQQSDQQDGIHIQNGSCTITAENCIFIGWYRGCISVQNAGTVTVNANSCTFWDAGYQANASFPGGGLANHNNTGNTFNAQNCLFLDCDNVTESGSIAEGAAATWNVSNCITTDAEFTAVGLDSSDGGNTESATFSEAGGGGDLLVEDITTLPFDLRLIDGASTAISAHTDAEAEGLTIPSTDVAGQERSNPYDIGAHSPVKDPPLTVGQYQG
jgi:hypothetical protein